MIGRTCDKCGRPVDPTNNAVNIDVGILALNNRQQDAFFLGITALPRHLLPVDGCPGSPSRAQYLEGQPRDPRPDYEYDELMEPLVREAYELMVKS